MEAKSTNMRQNPLRTTALDFRFHESIQKDPQGRTGVLHRTLERCLGPGASGFWFLSIGSVTRGSSFIHSCH